ncbi:MAG: right-handed parallel beta-helix repeat-containing protein [Candidatus Binatia bacterium]
MRTLLRCHLALAAIALGALTAHAADHAILGDTLSVTGSTDPARRRVSVKAREAASADALVGDPTVNGAMLTLTLSGTTPSRATYALPPGRSGANGRPFWSGDAARGFTYRDRGGENGPVRSVRVARTAEGTFLVQARVDGRLGAVMLAPPDRGSAACALLEIVDGDSYSVQFADGAVWNQGASRFRVRHPTAAGSCALPVGPDPTPVATVAPDSTLVGCEQAASRIAVTASVHLDPSCVYTRGLDVTASNVTLDCRGAAIVRDPAVNGTGIQIQTPADTPLHDVTVRNCHVSRFDNNLRVTRAGFKNLLPGAEYDHGTANILIEHNTFADSANSGVFVDGFVSGVRFSRNAVSGSGSVGIYLEAGSRDNVVEQSVVTDNGWKDVIPGPASFTIGMTTIYYLSTGREGIAVDGSRGNVIRDNVVADNAAGGIFAYKNCGENTSQSGHWVRRYGASGNRISHNRVSDGPNGIWIGSRAAENQLFMDCSDPPLVGDPALKVYRDPAPDNTIEFNRVAGMTNAIRVEADGTTVHGNFLSDADRGVLVGSRYLTTVSNAPIADTAIAVNTTSAVAEPYGWIWGTGTIAFDGNTADQDVGVWRPGTQPTINPFLFVVQVLGP